jgi:hypothetical protein
MTRAKADQHQIGREVARDVRAARPPDPSHKRPGSRGVVMAAGTPEHWLNAAVAVARLRAVGCALPVWIARLPGERPPADPVALLGPGTTLATLVTPGLRGWAVKPWALWEAPFDRCLWVDVDVVLLDDPLPLLDEDVALAFPDPLRYDDDVVFDVFPEVDPAAAEVESGLLALPTIAAARALWAVCRLNREHRAWAWAHLNGDKDTFRLGFAATGTPLRVREALPELLGHHAREPALGGRSWRLPARRGAPADTGLHHLGGPDTPGWVHRTVLPWRAFDPRPAWRWRQAVPAPVRREALRLDGTHAAPPALIALEAEILEALAAAGWHRRAIGAPMTADRARVAAERALGALLGGPP